MTKQPLGPIQQKWLAALRSGEFRQGTGKLRTADDRFCCLGVLSLICGEPGTLIAGLAYTFEGGFQATPSQRVTEMSGLYGKVGDSRCGSNKSPLYLLNDTGLTFPEIADMIEEDPSVYFKEPK